jgi:predicted PurR-regulated permease PerM
MNLFILGILSVVFIAMVAVIVVGIVKILKLTKQVKDLETTFFQTRGDLYRNIEERIQPIWRQFEDTGRDITMVEKTIMNRIDQNKQEVEQKIFEHAAASSRYIDSRIDKLIDTYFEYNAISKKSKKEVING